MHTLKSKNMMNSYTGFTGPETVRAVLSQIPFELAQRLTGHELGLVMNAVNNAFHNGQHLVKGIEVLPDDHCVYIDGKFTNGEGVLLPIEAFKTLRKVSTQNKDSITHNYHMNFTETL